MQFPLSFGDAIAWRRVPKNDWQARDLADRHYSRQTIGAEHFMPPGRSFVLLTYDGRAVWGVVQNRDPVGAVRWRCSIFRNEGDARSSDLIRIATAWTYAHWRARYGSPPPRPPDDRDRRRRDARAPLEAVRAGRVLPPCGLALLAHDVGCGEGSARSHRALRTGGQ